MTCRLAIAALLSLVVLAVASIEIDDSPSAGLLTSSGRENPIALPAILPITDAPTTTTGNSSTTVQLPLTNDQVRWAVDLAVSRLAGSDTSRELFIFSLQNEKKIKL
jgi:hypothetical protein